MATPRSKPTPLDMGAPLGRGAAPDRAAAGRASIVCTGLTFAWPDGNPVFTDLDLALSTGRTGLIGRNGCGKSTLLRLIAGELTPQRGSVSVTGTLGYLPQQVSLDVTTTVEQALGIDGIRRAIHAVEIGSTEQELYDRIGDDWDIDVQALATLDRLGLGHVELERQIGALSGGEAVLLRLAAELLRAPDVLLLDEPTNNLDVSARRRLYTAVDAWRGSLLVVSHDRDLLERIDQVADMRPNGVRVFGGTLSAYLETLEIEQQAAERMVRAAESEVKRERRELAESQTKQARRDRQGRRAAASGMPKMVAHARRRAAQETAGRSADVHEQRLAEARARLDQAEAAVRDDDVIRINLPNTSIPSGRIALQATDVCLRSGSTISLEVRGPERIALVGANGAGKTTLLRTVLGEIPTPSGDEAVRLPVPVRYLPQRLDVLDDNLSVVANVARFAPGAAENEIRGALARFLFVQRAADQRAGSLSGGERFRATLATLLLAQPAPQLLLLDEPTNNLDLDSVAQLRDALAAYSGALIVASHDLPFLRGIGITRWLELVPGGTDANALHEIDPP
jgi:ATPase subunit of ABC transporter with duplicated ATPase domains